VSDVYFYHLTRSALDAALRQLLERALGRGWRVVVRGQDAARLDWLDEKLWLQPDAGFLPHGRAGGAGPRSVARPDQGRNCRAILVGGKRLLGQKGRNRGRLIFGVTHSVNDLLI
jgi:DNA polymerase IIIc chi subunit